MSSNKSLDPFGYGLAWSGLINSILGILGQITKSIEISEIKNYIILLVAVLIGGQIGNFLNIKIFPTKILALITSLLVIFVALRIGYNFI